METSMTIRSFAVLAATIAIGWTSTAIPVIGGEIAHGAAAPFAVADAQDAAPDFTCISNWFNFAPLRMADLRGKVVLVDFWTYGCVNCVNTLPHFPPLNA